MTFRRLLPLIMRIESTQTVRNDIGLADAPSSNVTGGQDADTAPRECRVLFITDNSVFVNFDGKQVEVNMATDEPVRAGQYVWAAKTLDGVFICYGSVK